MTKNVSLDDNFFSSSMFKVSISELCESHKKLRIENEHLRERMIYADKMQMLLKEIIESFTKAFAAQLSIDSTRQCHCNEHLVLTLRKQVSCAQTDIAQLSERYEFLRQKCLELAFLHQTHANNTHKDDGLQVMLAELNESAVKIKEEKSEEEVMIVAEREREQEEPTDLSVKIPEKALFEAQILTPASSASSSVTWADSNCSSGEPIASWSCASSSSGDSADGEVMEVLEPFRHKKFSAGRKAASCYENWLHNSKSDLDNCGEVEAVERCSSVPRDLHTSLSNHKPILQSLLSKDVVVERIEGMSAVVEVEVVPRQLDTDASLLNFRAIDVIPNIKAPRRQNRLYDMSKKKTPYGRFQCPYPNCRYVPYYKRDLRRHMNKHIANKLYSCCFEGCNFNTIWRQSLQQHQRKFHATSL